MPKKIRKSGGKTELRGQMVYRKYDKDGKPYLVYGEDLGVLAFRKCLTDFFFESQGDTMRGNNVIGTCKYHGWGTGTTAVESTDLGLESSAAPTQGYPNYGASPHPFLVVGTQGGTGATYTTSAVIIAEDSVTISEWALYCADLFEDENCVDHALLLTPRALTVDQGILFTWNIEFTEVVES